ncbi:uncharacterized protein EDB93DRAFT_1108907 [Suillus bovinus]|uniref:uncharacterized protein n=1 Tax=Suillus bovinus TaxID=48563 RepID=UPI001B881BC6|nr:uncharacterized protein EDB93DRAFT_1108907 [Suillus bovinus]KAG2128765.1 hypothetical protein EDB93DRAFT_1108907 [Suillus bovinus]
MTMILYLCLFSVHWPNLEHLGALSTVTPLDYGYDLVEFFVFTQHVQYVKTGKLAFISNYQGSTALLTNPQILTHPSVSDGSDIFGDGNIEAVVSEFESKHICNFYCEWVGFGLEPFGKKDESLDEAESTLNEVESMNIT